MILWSSLGWEEEVESIEQAKEIVEEAIAYPEQKITLSKMVDGKQQDQVLYNGIDDEKAVQWLDMIKRSRELERGE
ncbi:hypothetical protein MWH28_12285 [Natroniella sulfidigena]|uniref:hypothetical protein n=1 Tax=Natroniella sulfidigena TaxID=723921 RepID=UPI00200ACD36|nr:hypothetical protein [Natroniella sulfidigena]MCK8818135.1 hypothetical protein [Natroniella sulfidigena]